MPIETLNNGSLFLPDLSIQGFRGIDDLSIKRLGHVTLFAGKNATGKTTLLDAVRVYAARGRYAALVEILRNREEYIETTDEDGDPAYSVDFKSLFYGRPASPDAIISIGTESKHLQISLQVDPFEGQPDLYSPTYILDEGIQSIRVTFQGDEQKPPVTVDTPRLAPPHSRRRVNEQSGFQPAIQCEFLGPSLPSNSDMTRFWDKVALTDDETRAVEALNLIFGGKVERVAMIGDDMRRAPFYSRRAMAKIKGEDRPIPLKSLGDGAVRLFGVALALANSRDGFLLIDEAENGIHHSVMRDFWKMVLIAAHKNNVQVFATTHSSDCVIGFARAAEENDEANGALVRIERHGEQVFAVEYSEKQLAVAAEQGIEVR